MGDLTDTTLFKTLDGLRPMHSGDGRYFGVGRGTSHFDPDRLEPLDYGYQRTRGRQLLRWWGLTLYVAEACPDQPPADAGHKLGTYRVRLVRRRDRWNETTA